jgi:hypothetical protein
MDAHKYICLIEFALRSPSFSVTEACEKCGLSEKEFSFVRDSIFVLSAYQTQHLGTKDVQEWVLSPAAYFGYLQFQGNRQATETANRAYWVAVIAIVLGIVIGAAQIVVSFI